MSQLTADFELLRAKVERLSQCVVDLKAAIRGLTESQIKAFDLIATIAGRLGFQDIVDRADDEIVNLGGTPGSRVPNGCYAVQHFYNHATTQSLPVARCESLITTFDRVLTNRELTRCAIHGGFVSNGELIAYTWGNESLVGNGWEAQGGMIGGHRVQDGLLIRQYDPTDPFARTLAERARGSGYPSDRESTLPNGLAGLGVYYGWYGSAVNQRVGLQLMTDVTIDERQVSSAILQYYVSIPPAKPSPKEKIVVKYRDKVREKRRYIVDAGFINFETKKFTVQSSDQAFLAELGEFLAKSRDKWATVFITSHTDHRGGDAINIDLSKNRAEAVAGYLSLPTELAERIQIKSRASTEPVESGDDQVSLARNRRVEIEVVGAIDVVSLKRTIAIIRQKHRGPGTCSGDTCL